MTNLEIIKNHYNKALTLIAEEYTVTGVKYPSDFPALFDGDTVKWKEGEDGMKMEDRSYVISSTDSGKQSYSFFIGRYRLDPKDNIAAYVEDDEQIVHFKTKGAISCDYEAAVMKADAQLYILDQRTNIIEKEEFDRQIMRDVLSQLIED